jgi:Acetyltransferase (GNAT) domain
LSVEYVTLAPGTAADDYLSLFKDCFPETLGTSLSTAPYYQWKYGAVGKYAPSLEYGGYEDGRMVGYYAALPFQYSLGGSTVLGSLVCDVMTHSSMRGRGIFTSMGRFATNSMASAGVAFCTGFPIRPSVIPGHLKVGWRVAFDLPVYCRIVDMRIVAAARGKNWVGSLLQPAADLYPHLCRLGRRRARNLCCTQHTVESFFGQVDYAGFYAQWRRQHANHLIRTEEFLRWRLAGPDLQYRIIALHDEDRLAGIAITRNTRSPGFEVVGLADVMILDEYIPVSGMLHDEIAALARRSGAAGVSLMCAIPDARRLHLTGNGYIRTPYKFQFIAKWLADGDAPQCLWDAREWHLMWLDADTI